VKNKKLFDLSIEASENFDKIPELLKLLSTKGFLAPSVYEPQESADQYCKAYVEAYNVPGVDKRSFLKSDLIYWSDRWCFSRAYTLKYFWENSFI
jgi:hypothetical protein